ncbi:MAG: hypothetical protein C0513_08300 [Isosphaera sp.]|nr:hypothetical protein [Isosphaera sp.]
MPEGANLRSTEALLRLKAAIERFIEQAVGALTEVEADAQRGVSRMTRQLGPYWLARTSRLSEDVARARSALVRKEGSALTEHASVVDERRALETAKSDLETARQKVKLVRAWAVELERQHEMYRGAVTALAEVLQQELPHACEQLRRMVEAVEGYQRIAVPESRPLDGEHPAPGPAEAGPAMRSAAEAVPAASGAATEPAQEPREPIGVPPADGTSAADPPPSPWARLVRRVPGPAVRAGVALRAADGAGARRGAQHLTGHAGRPPAAHGGPSDSDGALQARRSDAARCARTLAGLGLVGQPPAPGDKIVYAAGCLDGRDVFLHRVAPAAGDSGWYIGPVADAGGFPGFVGLGAAELARRRPDLWALAGVVPGHTIVWQSGGVVAVLGPDGRECQLGPGDGGPDREHHAGGAAADGDAS